MQKLIKSLENANQVESILRNERHLEINKKDNHGDTALHFASRAHNVPVMRLLVKYGADIEAVNEHGRRPLHEAIDSVDCVKYLVTKCKADVNAMKRGDWTPTMIAAMKGYTEIVTILVNAGALLNRTTKDGRSALYLATQEGHIELAKYLTDKCPNTITQTTNSGRLPIQAAAALSYDEKGTAAYEITTYFLQRAQIPVSSLLLHRDNSGRNLLLDAAVSQNLELLKYLLDQGADPNDKDSLGRTMVHHAAMMSHLNVLYLLQLIPSIKWDLPDLWDLWTPLMHSSRQGHLAAVEFLVEDIGVNLYHQDKLGRTASDVAILWHHEDIVNYLHEANQR
ncbi:ankyrin repeat-containing domain protein [Sporodiniella umbellata]|nr:ankyrin repeat-containing domain protein [Sporodiniella umbellata]